jgi:GNAT superfamily N-acetyltransferase
VAIIRQAIFPDDTASVLSIWPEFIANSPVNLDYQGNDAEFVGLPGKYAAPSGRVLLAEQCGEVVGCVAFRKVSDEICEMKRMYVRPSARGNHLGRDLVERLIVEARVAGYQEIRLDVMEKSVSARRLYEALGFVPAEPISFNPVPGASFLGLKIAAALPMPRRTVRDSKGISSSVTSPESHQRHPPACAPTLLRRTFASDAACAAERPSPRSAHSSAREVRFVTTPTFTSSVVIADALEP